MELIFFGLMLLIAAILFPDGMRALLAFLVKATFVAVIVIAGVLIVFGMLSRANSPTPQKVAGPRVYYPARVITLSDGTKINVEGGWSDD
jgi:hypothetical protein